MANNAAGWLQPIKSKHDFPGNQNPVPTDFIGTKKHIERVIVLQRGECFGMRWPTPFGPGFGSMWHIVVVRTQDGPLQVKVSRQTYDMIYIGDPIVITYQKGRWTGALKGKIAG